VTTPAARGQGPPTPAGQAPPPPGGQGPLAEGQALTAILFDRLRFTAVVVIAATAFYAFLDVILAQPNRATLHLIEAVILAAAAGIFVIPRYPRVLAHTESIATFLACLLPMVIAWGALLRDEALAGSMLIVITVLVAAAVLPWGWPCQAVLVAASLACIVTVIRSDPETVRLLTRDPASIVAIGLGLGFSVLIAHQHRRIRVGIQREHERLRALQAEVLAMNAVLERRVAERTAELRTAADELASFGYSISHDLRQPLRSIASFSQILADSARGRLDSEETDWCGRIHAAARRMDGLLDEFLRLSRMATRPMKRERVDLGEVFANVAGELDRRDPARAVRWEIGQDLVVEGDEELLATLLHELAENAWKFTEDCEEAVVEFDVEIGADGTRTFFVRDNGCGFEPTRDRDVFKLFSRAIDGSVEDGFGTGLASAESIVKRHGGTMRAESEPDEGATFYFTLPAPALSN
jgi:signal transduction histidine kinase